MFESDNRLIEASGGGVDIAEVVPACRIARFGPEHAGVGRDRPRCIAALLVDPGLDPGKVGDRAAPGEPQCFILASCRQQRSGKVSADLEVVRAQLGERFEMLQRAARIAQFQRG